MSSGEGLTVLELREGLHRHLRDSGGLNTLKTQLRTMMLTDLNKKQQGGNPKAAWETGNNAGGSTAADGPAPGSTAGGWAGKAADALVESHLRGTKPYTHSVLLSESSISADLEDAELREFLSLPFVDGRSKLNKTGSGEVTPLTALIQHHLSTTTHRHLNSNGTQTETNEPTSLEHKLALIDARFSLRHTTRVEESSARTETIIKQKVAEVEAQMTQQLRHELEQWKNRELVEMRAQEELKFQSMLAGKREEFDAKTRDLQHRVDMERQRLDEVRRTLAQQESFLEKRQKELIHEQKDSEQMVDVLQAQVVGLKEKARQLASQVTHYQDLSEDRLHQVERTQIREQKLKDEINKTKSEHLQELRLRDHELASLRYKLQVTTAAYQRGQAAHGSVAGSPPRHGRTASAGGGHAAPPPLGAASTLPSEVHPTYVDPTNPTATLGDGGIIASTSGYPPLGASVDSSLAAALPYQHYQPPPPATSLPPLSSAIGSTQQSQSVPPHRTAAPQQATADGVAASQPARAPAVAPLSELLAVQQQQQLQPAAAAAPSMSTESPHRTPPNSSRVAAAVPKAQPQPQPQPQPHTAVQQQPQPQAQQQPPGRYNTLVESMEVEQEEPGEQEDTVNMEGDHLLPDSTQSEGGSTIATHDTEIARLAQATREEEERVAADRRQAEHVFLTAVSQLLEDHEKLATTITTSEVSERSAIAEQRTSEGVAVFLSFVQDDESKTREEIVGEEDTNRKGVKWSENRELTRIQAAAPAPSKEEDYYNAAPAVPAAGALARDSDSDSYRSSSSGPGIMRSDSSDYSDW